MTDFVKTKDIKNNWILVDATNAIVGRLAVFISKTIRGKNKSNYTPHMDHGDFIIVKGSVPGTYRRLIKLRKQIRNEPNKISKPNILEVVI